MGTIVRRSVWCRQLAALRSKLRVWQERRTTSVTYSVSPSLAMPSLLPLALIVRMGVNSENLKRRPHRHLSRHGRCGNYGL